MCEETDTLVQGLLSLLIEKWPAGGYCTRIPWRRAGYVGGSEFMGSWFFEKQEDAKNAVLELAKQRGERIANDRLTADQSLPCDRKVATDHPPHQGDTPAQVMGPVQAQDSQDHIDAPDAEV